LKNKYKDDKSERPANNIITIPKLFHGDVIICVTGK